MKNKILIFLCLFLFFIQNVFAQFLINDEEFSNIKSLKIVEQLLYESYLDMSHGPVAVLGYSFDTYLQPDMYFSAVVNGIVNGVQGGFGIVAFGPGIKYKLDEKFSLNSRLVLGSGGGGGVKGGGGFMYKITSALEYKLNDVFESNVRLGYLDFPMGDFKTLVFSVGIGFRYFRFAL